MRLRSRLTLLIALTVVPVLLFSVILAAALADERETALEHSTRESAQLFAVAVRREIDAVIASLEALAGSSALERLDLAEFRTEAEHIRQRHVGWQNIIVADASGRMILNVAAALERDVSLADRTYFQTALREQRPAVSDLLTSRVLNRPVIAVAAPVIRAGEVRLVVVIGLDPVALVEPLAAAEFARGQAFRVFDRSRTTVARFPIDHSVIGTPPGPLFAAIEAGARSDWTRFKARTGHDLYAANVEMPEYGWMASLSMPVDQIEAPWRESLMWMSGGGLGLLALSLVAAFTVGRRIERPISTLVGKAEAVGGAAFDYTPTGVREIDEVGAALIATNRLLRERADERTRYEAALAERARELTEANRLKDEFLATVSHELRSPLNAIAGWAQMLKMGVPADDDARTRAIETIQRNARVQEQLINDLLDVSRIVTGKLRFAPRPVDLGAVVESAMEVVRPAADAKGVALETSLEAPIRMVMGDPDRLQQVLWNLLSNGVKFTSRGGHVRVRLARHNSHLDLSVSDDGSGISQEFLPHVFERFRQADSGLNRQYGGLGLGLSIVRHIVELHGGTVSVASDGPGHGASFTIALPVVAVRPDAGAASAAQSPAASGAEALAGVRALVVEDEPDALELIATVLAGAGAATEQARTADAAWSALQRDTFDVMVCDISMPNEDGYSLVRRVRAMDDPARSRLPAVALTAQTRPEDRARAIVAGFQVHVPKPVETTELIAVVAMLTGRSSFVQVKD